MTAIVSTAPHAVAPVDGVAGEMPDVSRDLLAVAARAVPQQVIAAASVPFTAAGVEPLVPFAHDRDVPVSVVTAPNDERCVVDTEVTAEPFPGTGRVGGEDACPNIVAVGPAPVSGASLPAAAAAFGAGAGAGAADVDSATSAAAAGPPSPAAGGVSVTGAVRPAASCKAQKNTRTKRPRKEAPAGDLAPAPAPPHLNPALPPIPPYAQLLAAGGSGGSAFPPGLNHAGLGGPGHWDWIAASMASATLAAAASMATGGGSGPMVRPPPFPALPMQPAGVSSTPGPVMDPASVADAHAAAAMSGNVGVNPAHHLHPGTVVVPRGSEVAVAPTQADEAAVGGGGDSRTAGDHDNGAQEVEAEETFLTGLVNSMDPADPKTLRLRAAMMSRLTSIGHGSC